jgi:ketosteroid isomerase-like protein
MDEALGLMNEDATWWVGGTTALSGTYTKPEFAALVGNISQMAPGGLHVTPTLLTAEGDRVSVEATSFAEINNGRTYRNTYHFMMVVRDGKFSAIREYLDTEHVTATFAP